jgi:phosphopantothenoylcysteine decarboxylase/phosphopantothenate--cysteine ligase
MKGLRRALVALAAGLALADASIVALALPPILAEMDTTITGVAAIIGVYALVLALALPAAASADVYCVAPASANTIAKLAHGLADNLLTSAALACTAPLVVAPAMNNHMYEHPATRENLERLRARGARIVEPESGRLASRGEWGVGRLAEPATILDAIEQALGPPAGGPLDGLRVLVTAGGTREPIDSVRYVGNRSSGRMGLALAEEAARRGAEVRLVAANVSLPAPPGVELVEVSTAAELLEAAQSAFAGADVLLMAAAVADFRPASSVEDKIVKTGRDGLALELEPTADVLATLAEARSPAQTLIGFAAEHGEGAVERGRAKLERKGLDAIVVNDISRPEIGFDAPDNEVTIVTATGERHVPLGSKQAVAAAIIDEVESLRSEGVRPSTVE